jgi:hypothetical protein
MAWLIIYLTIWKRETTHVHNEGDSSLCIPWLPFREVVTALPSRERGRLRPRVVLCQIRKGGFGSDKGWKREGSQVVNCGLRDGSDSALVRWFVLGVVLASATEKRRRGVRSAVERCSAEGSAKLGLGCWRLRRQRRGPHWAIEGDGGESPARSLGVEASRLALIERGAHFEWMRGFLRGEIGFYRVKKDEFIKVNHNDSSHL